MNKLLKQAFTLIELLVVIAIIGILSGLIVVAMNGTTQKATIAKSQVFSNSLRNSLMMNLVSEWKFDELTTAVQGSTIQDTWNGGNNAILSTNSDGLDKIKTGTNCVSGSCLSFDGTDDYAYVSGSDAVTSNLAITGAITLSVWVKFLEGLSARQTIVARGRPLGGGDYGYSLMRFTSDSKLYFYLHDGTLTYSALQSPLITDNSWYYFVVSWDGTTNTNGIKLYIDGVLKSQATSSIPIMNQPAYQFRIGADSAGSYPLNGSIDDVRIYNTSIPISQIKEQYYAGLNKLLASGGITKEEYQNRINQLAINE